MVRRHKVFLLDEPLSNLDAQLRAQMRVEHAGLQRRLGTTTVYVTHDQTDAMTLGDRVAILRAGEVQQVGIPREVYAQPAKVFVASFIGTPAMNLIPGRLEGERLTLPMGRPVCPSIGPGAERAGRGPWLSASARGPAPRGDRGSSVRPHLDGPGGSRPVAGCRALRQAHASFTLFLNRSLVPLASLIQPCAPTSSSPKGSWPPAAHRSARLAGALTSTTCGP